MVQLTFIRHAQYDRRTGEILDSEVERIAELVDVLCKENVVPQKIISAPALRAIQTSEKLVEAFSKVTGVCLSIEEEYRFDEYGEFKSKYRAFLPYAEELDKEGVKSVCVVSHKPTLYAISLFNKIRMDKNNLVANVCKIIADDENTYSNDQRRPGKIIYPDGHVIS